MKIVICTGGFDPIHPGHTAYLREARKLGDLLVVGVNSDEWLIRKKGRFFMTFNDRKAIIESLIASDVVFQFDDSDGTAIDLIERVLAAYPSDEIIFANGGDRTDVNIPEMKLQDPRLSFVFGVGGDTKMNSSSSLLSGWINEVVDRQWGKYTVLYSPSPGIKVKELTVYPGKSLSFQQHLMRSEEWFVVSGDATVLVSEDGVSIETVMLSPNQRITIPSGAWHQLMNRGSQPLHVIEIQYGTLCDESDIIRK